MLSTAVAAWIASSTVDGVVPGLDHLVLGRQVDPELKAPHHAVLGVGHLAVHQAPACCHPLHSPWPNDALHG